MSVDNATTQSPRNASTVQGTQTLGGIQDAELRQIVDVATSYLATGLFDDADDILQEVIEAGAASPEIDALIRQIEEARGATGNQGTAVLNGASDVRTVRRKPIVYLTAPLPGAERLPRPIQRLIAETERDFADGRHSSALDLCFVIAAEAPSYVPNYLRAAQIRVALGDADGAEELVETVEKLYALEGVESDPMVQSLRVALNPEDSRALVEHAKYLLANQPAGSANPFLPAAIEATQDSEPATARELARALVERNPNDHEAVRVYLRSAVSTAAPDEIHQALESRVTPDVDSVDLLWWRAGSAAVSDDPSWTLWLSRTAEHVRNQPDSFGVARDAVERSKSFVSEHIRYLGGAVIALAAGQWDIALAELDDWKQTSAAGASAMESFIAACAEVETIEFLGQQGIIPAMDDLIITSLAIPTDTMGDDLQLFTSDVSRPGIFDRYRTALDIHDSMTHGIDFIQTLTETYPDNLDLRQLYAQMLIDHGKLNDGIRELRQIAKIHEQQGNLTAMAEAMRTISRAVPENIDIKQTLIDIYLKRGILDEALTELEAMAEIKIENGDIAGAIAAYTRAAEIAYAMGNFALGNELYDRGVASDPDNVPVRHAAVAFYLQIGAADRAAEQLREVVRIALAANEPDEAVAALHQIIGLVPTDYESFHKLGEVLTAMGEYHQAERVYRRLAEAVPNDPVLQAKQSALAVLAATG